MKRCEETFEFPLFLLRDMYTVTSYFVFLLHLNFFSLLWRLDPPIRTYIRMLYLTDANKFHIQYVLWLQAHVPVKVVTPEKDIFVWCRPARIKPAFPKSLFYSASCFVTYYGPWKPLTSSNLNVDGQTLISSVRYFHFFVFFFCFHRHGCSPSCSAFPEIFNERIDIELSSPFSNLTNVHSSRINSICVCTIDLLVFTLAEFKLRSLWLRISHWKKI